ncbi:unnamed protein product [Amoebophrya sp. A120]|nr:unnamed protein product [Amoebophrya sp. A120]|eukprot:GSA120T00016154001.1
MPPTSPSSPSANKPTALARGTASSTTTSKPQNETIQVQPSSPSKPKKKVAVNTGGNPVQKLMHLAIYEYRLASVICFLCFALRTGLILLSSIYYYVVEQFYLEQNFTTLARNNFPLFSLLLMAAFLIFYLFFAVFAVPYYQKSKPAEIYATRFMREHYVKFLPNSFHAGPRPPIWCFHPLLQFLPWMLQNGIHGKYFQPAREVHYVRSFDLENKELDENGEERTEGDGVKRNMAHNLKIVVIPPFAAGTKETGGINTGGAAADRNQHSSSSSRSSRTKPTLTLPDSAPIVFILPGLACDAEDLPGIHQILYANHRGYRVVVLERRGQGQGLLESPRFNIFGDVFDLEIAFNHVVNNVLPDKTVEKFCIGISAGSALLVTAMGKFDRRRRELEAVMQKNAGALQVQPQDVEQRSGLSSLGESRGNKGNTNRSITSFDSAASLVSTATGSSFNSGDVHGSSSASSSTSSSSNISSRSKSQLKMGRGSPAVLIPNETAKNLNFVKPIPPPKFDAGCALYPGFDIAPGGCLTQCSPLFDSILVNGVQSYFLIRNEKILREFDNEAYEEAINANSFEEIVDAMCVFAGYKSGREKFDENENPVRFFPDITETPILTVIGEDDPISNVKNFKTIKRGSLHENFCDEKTKWKIKDSGFGKTNKEHIETSEDVQENPWIVVVAQSGSHCPMLDGMFWPFRKETKGLACWSDKAVFDFFDRRREVLKEEERGRQENAKR